MADELDGTDLRAEFDVVGLVAQVDRTRGSAANYREGWGLWSRGRGWLTRRSDTQYPVICHPVFLHSLPIRSPVAMDPQ